MSRATPPAPPPLPSPTPPAAPVSTVPDHPLLAACYMATSLLLALTQGLGMNFIATNILQIEGSLGATTVEATWLTAAYMAPNVSLAILLIKIRTQFGLRRFAELGILLFILVACLHLAIDDLRSAIIVRFIAGIAASPLSSLAFLYMLEAFQPAQKLTVGVSLAMTNIALGLPLARVLSPALLDIGLSQRLYLMEMALAALSFAAVYLLPLTSPPRAKVIERLDILSYGLIAISFGLIAIVLSVGRYYWWAEVAWLGWMLAVAIVALTAVVIIELHRSEPLVDIRWLACEEMVRFALAILVIRVLLSVQNVGTTTFFQALGIVNDQTVALYGVVVVVTAVAGVACALVIQPGREPYIHMMALLCLAIGAGMESQATNLTRPDDLYLSQGLIAVSLALFLPPTMSVGLADALPRGLKYLLSFFVVFLVTQSIGGLLGSALYGSFITIREKFHSHQLVEQIVLSNPVVAQQVARLSAAYGRVVGDASLLQAEGMTLLGQQVTREANVLAHNDAFMVTAVLAVLALTILVIHQWLRSLRRAAGPADLPVQG